MAAGERRRRFTFFSISPISGDLGTERGDPVAQFTRNGKLTPLRGGEEVMAARLQSRQPYNLEVLQDSRTRQVTTDWQIRDEAGVLYNIRTIIDPDNKRSKRVMLVESGVAA
jgi:hypothetical protein